MTSDSTRQASVSSYQTVRLGRGRHAGPGPVVCVMELASMLAGERFSDRPRAVCPLIGALLRVYNDRLRDEERQELYHYAAECVGTRASPELERRRAEHAIRWAQSRYEGRALAFLQPWRRFCPDADSGPDAIAVWVIRAIRRVTDSTHRELLALVDELIEMTAAEAGGETPTGSSTRCGVAR